MDYIPWIERTYYNKQKSYYIKFRWADDDYEKLYSTNTRIL